MSDPIVIPAEHLREYLTHKVELTHERIVAIRTELIRLAHCDSGNPEAVVARADAYLSFILNGTSNKGELTNAD